MKILRASVTSLYHSSGSPHSNDPPLPNRGKFYIMFLKRKMADVHFSSFPSSRDVFAVDTPAPVWTRVPAALSFSCAENASFKGTISWYYRNKHSQVRLVLWVELLISLWLKSAKLSVECSSNFKAILLQRNICIPIFIAAWSTIAKGWKQLKCPMTDERRNKMQCLFIFAVV